MKKMQKLNLGRRVELHTHSLLSDGELLPSEIAQRALALGYEAIAVTDHVDASNLEFVVEGVKKAVDLLQKHLDIALIPGVELTYIPPDEMEGVVKLARRLGASLIVIHGETIVEPVIEGTNRAAVDCSDVDILAHPGFIKEEEAELALAHGIYLELSSRRGHCLTNGHTVKVALKTKTKLIVNTDSHSPEELISQDEAFKVALGAGLGEEEAVKVVRDHPKEILRRLNY